MHRTTLFRFLTAGLAGLVLFAPDDGAGSGDGGTGDGDGAAGAGDGAASTGAGTGATDAGDGADSQSKDTGKTFTQEEFATAVAKERAKATKAAETEATKKAERQKLDETERLRAEKDDAEKAANARVETANRRLVTADVKTEALAQDVDPAVLTQFVKLVETTDIDVSDDGDVDPKAVKAAVTAALKTVPMMKKNAGGSGGTLGGDMGGEQKKTKATTLEDAVLARIAS